MNNSGKTQEKQWETPVVNIFSRSFSEEVVLGFCKDAQASSGPEGASGNPCTVNIGGAKCNAQVTS